MGSVFSKKIEPNDELASVVEKLKDVDQAIMELHRQEYKVSNYFLVAILIAVFAMAINFVLKKPGIHLGLVAFAGIVIFIILYIFCRYGLSKFYKYRTSKQIKYKNSLTRRRSEIFKGIKEKLPYKDARELLLKYGNESDLEEVGDKSPPKLPNAVITAATPAPINSLDVTATPLTSKPGKIPVNVQRNGQPLPNATPMTQFKTPIRPFPGNGRTPIDKIIDFVVGDGPNNRYALICKRCHVHNGMALPEEFLSLSFKCYNCEFMNPSKRSEQAEFPGDGPLKRSEQAEVAGDGIDKN